MFTLFILAFVSNEKYYCLNQKTDSYLKKGKFWKITQLHINISNKYDKTNINLYQIISCKLFHRHSCSTHAISFSYVMLKANFFLPLVYPAIRHLFYMKRSHIRRGSTVTVTSLGKSSYSDYFRKDFHAFQYYCLVLFIFIGFLELVFLLPMQIFHRQSSNVAMHVHLFW